MLGIYRVKLESALVTDDVMLPMGNCQFLSPLCPPKVETAVFGNQQGHLWNDTVRGVVFRGAPEDLPGTGGTSSSGSMPPEAVFDSSTSQTHVTSYSTCRTLSRASSSTSCLIHIGVGRGIIRTTIGNWEKLCNCWFELATVQRRIWGNDPLSCGFGLQLSYLALN